jgi:hypothetical protein
MRYSVLTDALYCAHCVIFPQEIVVKNLSQKLQFVTP